MVGRVRRNPTRQARATAGQIGVTLAWCVGFRRSSFELTALRLADQPGGWKPSGTYPAADPRLACSPPASTLRTNPGLLVGSTHPTRLDAQDRRNDEGRAIWLAPRRSFNHFLLTSPAPLESTALFPFLALAEDQQQRAGDVDRPVGADHAHHHDEREQVDAGAAERYSTNDHQPRWSTTSESSGSASG